MISLAEFPSLIWQRRSFLHFVFVFNKCVSNVVLFINYFNVFLFCHFSYIICYFMISIIPCNRDLCFKNVGKFLEFDLWSSRVSDVRILYFSLFVTMIYIFSPYFSEVCLQTRKKSLRCLPALRLASSGDSFLIKFEIIMLLTGVFNLPSNESFGSFWSLCIIIICIFLGTPKLRFTRWPLSES